MWSFDTQPRTLRAKLLWINALLLMGLLALAGVSFWGLRVQRHHVEASLAEYRALQWVESAEVKVISAKAKLTETSATAATLLPEFRSAMDDLRNYKALLLSYDTFLPAEIPKSQKADAKARTKLATIKLAALIAMLDRNDESTLSSSTQNIAKAADESVMSLADLLRVCNTFLNETELASQRDVRRFMFGVAVLAAVIPLMLLLASLWQYRQITLPLNRLRRWSRQIAGGDLSQPYQAVGDREFVELGEDFNTMAQQLQAFYRKLEEMVATKSKELVRSERLASVGYLAAGVAHEINNPLNIMSGYAELSVKRLRRSVEPEVVAEVVKTLGVIREEAFRCKEITRKLLSLARKGSDSREAVSMMQLASEVALMVRGLPNFHGRRLNVAIDPADQLLVEANASEMKQVVLNLLINALEAVRPDSGEVTVEGSQAGQWITLSVRDNGRGMTSETVDRVFEPFYTNKRGVAEPGTGLGLSITHAIVADHGGEIRARSDGPDRGSCFTVRLPAKRQDGFVELNREKTLQTQEQTR
jgi:two-component system NtrC family sensor kinase